MAKEVARNGSPATIGGFGIGKIIITNITTKHPESEGTDTPSVVLIGCVVKCTSEMIGHEVCITYCTSEPNGGTDIGSVVGPERNERNLSEMDATTTDETLTADTLSTHLPSKVAAVGMRSTSAGDAN